MTHHALQECTDLALECTALCHWCRSDDAVTARNSLDVLEDACRELTGRLEDLSRAAHRAERPGLRLVGGPSTIKDLAAELRPLLRDPARRSELLAVIDREPESRLRSRGLRGELKGSWNVLDAHMRQQPSQVAA